MMTFSHKVGRLLNFCQLLPKFWYLQAYFFLVQESRESLQGAIRRGDLSEVQSSIRAEGGRTLARAQNSFGRTTLHIGVLAEQEEIVAYLAQNCPELLRIGDNVRNLYPACILILQSY